MFEIFWKIFDFFYSTTFGRFLQMAALNGGTDDILDNLAALNELCATVLYPPPCPLTMSLITKKVNFTKQLLKARYTSFKQTTLSTQAAKTKRYHRQNHERPFTERVFTP